MLSALSEWKGKLALVAGLCVTRVFASHIETIKVYSESMRKNIPAIIVLPDNFSKDIENYACMILLHGWGSNYLSWRWAYDTLKSKADKYNMIIVCPDGGVDSWYINNPFKKNKQYETFIAKELIDYLVENYNVAKNNQKRCIGGISMGGHGAAYLCLKYKHVFGGFASTSGALDLAEFPNGWNLKQILGNASSHPARWKAHSAISYLPQLVNNELVIWIDCGKDDFMLPVNRKFHQHLASSGIDHQYHEWEGNHDDAYWANSIPKILDYFGSLLQNKQ